MIPEDLDPYSPGGIRGLPDRWDIRISPNGNPVLFLDSLTTEEQKQLGSVLKAIAEKTGAELGRILIRGDIVHRFEGLGGSDTAAGRDKQPIAAELVTSSVEQLELPLDAEDAAIAPPRVALPPGAPAGDELPMSEWIAYDPADTIDCEKMAKGGFELAELSVE